MSYPVIYYKGDQQRSAQSRTEEVQLKFDGYAKDSPVLDIVSYRELQKQAKELGIPANQSAVELSAAIDAKLTEEAEDRFGGGGSVLEAPAVTGWDES